MSFAGRVFANTIGQFVGASAFPSAQTVSLIVVLFVAITAPVRSAGQTWTPLSPGGPFPSARYATSAIYDPISKNLVIFGGYPLSADAWRLANANGVGQSQWTNITPGGTGPAARRGHSAVYDSANDRMVVFGGFSDTGTQYFGDTWVLVHAAGKAGDPLWSQLNPANAPPSRAYHSAVYDATSNRMTVYGGFRPGGGLNEVWVLSNANGIGSPVWTQVSPTGTAPTALFDTQAVYDPTTNKMIVFAGQIFGSGGTLQDTNDCWILTSANGVGSSQWIKLNPAGSRPVPRFGHGAIYDPGTNRLTIAFGSNASGVHLLDTWILANANGVGTPNWTQLNLSGTGLSEPAAAYDAATNRMILFGGGLPSLVNSNDVYYFDNANGTPNPSPAVTSLSPSSITFGSPAFTLTVSGNNFVAPSSVQWNGIPRTTTFVSSTQLTAAIPASDVAALGTANVSVSNPAPGGGASSQVFSVTGFTPTISSISPAVPTASSSDQTLSVSGTNFQSGLTVSVTFPSGGSTVLSGSQILGVTSTSFQLLITLNGGGTWSIRVNNPNASPSNVFTFTVNSPSPQMTGISPTTANAGSGQLSLTVNGSNFLSTSVVQWNGSARQTTFVSGTQLTATITSADLAAPGTAQITVSNPSPGGGVSSALLFTISNPVPVITSINPASAATGGPAFTLTVNGSNFVSSSQVRWNGSPRPTQFITSSQLTAAIPASDLAAAGPVSVTVFNPTPGGGSSTAVTFTVQGPAAQLVVQELSLTFRGTNALPPPSQAIRISNSGGSTLSWTATAASTGNWLSISPETGSTPGSAQVRANTAILQPGSSEGTITVRAVVPGGATLSETVRVTASVTEAGEAKLTVDPGALSFEIEEQTVNPPSQSLSVGNSGKGSLSWLPDRPTIFNPAGSDWLVVAPSALTATAAEPASLTVTANTSSLRAGLYQGQITIRSSTTGESKTVATSLRVFPKGAQSLLISQNGLTFTGVARGGPVPSQSFGILNLGSGDMNWTVEASVLSGNSWLSVSPTGGVSRAKSLDIPTVEVKVDTNQLDPGRYTGSLLVRAPGADNSPQTVGVDLTVLPAGSTLPILVRPKGLIFAAIAGGAPPPARTARVATATPGTVTVDAGPFSPPFTWLDVSPRRGSFSPSAPLQLSIAASQAGLTPGVYSGNINLGFGPGNPSQTIDVLFQVISASVAAQGNHPPNAAACSPKALQLTPRILAGAYAVPTGYPTTIEVEVKDDCGNTVPNDTNKEPATVISTFSNGDRPVTLVHVGNGEVGRGVYQGTWIPAKAQASTKVTTRAIAGGLQGQAEITGEVTANLASQKVFPGGIVDAASYSQRFAPGGIISVFGTNLGNTTAISESVPLQESLAGIRIDIGGRPAPLFFSSSGQINAQVPTELQPNPRHQVVVKGNQTGAGTPFVAASDVITLIDSSPAIFLIPDDKLTNVAFKGQGAIQIANTTKFAAPPESIRGATSEPVPRGGFITIYCTGLGATNPEVPSGRAAPADPAAVVLKQVTATIGGVNARVTFAGLTPGFVALYQVNVEVPQSVQPANDAKLVLTQNGISSNEVTFAVAQ